MSKRQPGRTDIAGSGAKRRKLNHPSLPNRGTAKTIPRFQMRTKHGVLITVPHITAHVEMIAQEQKRRRILDCKHTRPQRREK